MANSARVKLAASIKSRLTYGDDPDLHLASTNGGDTSHRVHTAIVFPKAGGLSREIYEKSMELGRLPDPFYLKFPHYCLTFLVQYLYTSEYEPRMLPDASDNSNGPNAAPHYGFPHSCGPADVCPAPNLCLHHCCMDHASLCCEDFTCSQCKQEVAPADPEYAFSPDQLILHLRMAAMGRFLEVVGLESLAFAKLMRACKRFWDTEEFVSISQLISKFDEDHLLPLKDCIFDIISQHDTLFEKKDIHELLRNRSEFAYGVLMKERAKNRR